MPSASNEKAKYCTGYVLQPQRETQDSIFKHIGQIPPIGNFRHSHILNNLYSHERERKDHLGEWLNYLRLYIESKVAMLSTVGLICLK